MSNSLKLKLANRAQRAGRVRATVRGTTDRPRLSVHVSSRHITAQVINDETSKTLAYRGKTMLTGSIIVELYSILFPVFNWR